MGKNKNRRRSGKGGDDKGKVDNKSSKSSNTIGFLCNGTIMHTTQVRWFRVDSVDDKDSVTQLELPRGYDDYLVADLKKIPVIPVGSTTSNPPVGLDELGFSAAPVGSKMVVLGGQILLHMGIKACKHAYLVDKYGGWTRLPNMLNGRYIPSVVSARNRIYVFGSHILNPTHQIVHYGEYLDLSRPKQQRKWEYLPDPPFGKNLKARLWTHLVALFPVNDEEINVGVSRSEETYSLKLDTHEWTISKRYPKLRWLRDADVIHMGDIEVLLVHWMGRPTIDAYDLNKGSWFEEPVTGLDPIDYISKMFQSARKRDVYLVTCGSPDPVHPSFCIRFRVTLSPDRSTVSATHLKKTGPFDIGVPPYRVMPLGEEGKEEGTVAKGEEAGTVVKGDEGEEAGTVVKGGGM